MHNINFTRLIILVFLTLALLTHFLISHEFFVLQHDMMNSALKCTIYLFKSLYVTENSTCLKIHPKYYILCLLDF